MAFVFLTAVAEQAEVNQLKVAQILQLYERLKQDLQRLTPSSFTISILDAMFNQPIFTVLDIANQGKMPSRQHLSAMFNTLADGGILIIERPGGGRQARIFALRELLNICEADRFFIYVRTPASSCLRQRERGDVKAVGEKPLA